MESVLYHQRAVCVCVVTSILQLDVCPESEVRGCRSLTPGRVFCSCRALCAFRADSLAQYVRKAHPAGGDRETLP